MGEVGRGVWRRTVAAVVGAAIVGLLGGQGLAQGGAGEPPAGAPEGARIAYHAETGRVRFLGAAPGESLSGEAELQAEGGAESVADAFLARQGALFGVAEPGRDLERQGTVEGLTGRRAVRYQQRYQGIPVLAGELVVQLDANSRVLAAAGEALPEPSVDVTPRIDADEACRRAIAAVARARGEEAALRCEAPTLWVYNPVLLGGPGPRVDRLVWRTEVRNTEAAPVREFVLVDAHLGAIALQFSMVDDALVRAVYDKANALTDTLPGTLVRAEGAPPSGISDADRAYQFLGDAYAVFAGLVGRDSWDGAGGTLAATTRYCDPLETCPYENAFWNGEQLVFGEGYSQADDVVAHEYAHAVTEFSAHLFYYSQSGAMNEALSDIWGEFADLGNTYDGAGGSTRWLMGEDLAGGAMRSLSNPPAYAYDLTGWSSVPYPDRMTHTGYYCGTEDNGGVHLNSGIGAKAAFLLSDGGAFNGYTVVGIGIPKTAAVFYEAQTQLLTSGAGWAELGDALVQAASNLVADAELTAGDQAQVQKAVAAVEMDEQPPACAVEAAPVCATGVPQYAFADDLETPASGNWLTYKLAGSYNTFYYPQNPNAVGFDATYAHSGVTNIWGYDQPYVGDFAIAMTHDVVVPPEAFLRFDHAYSFEPEVYDGGVVEYSIDGGASWVDAGALFTHNGYTGVISSGWSNPLGGRSAFTWASQGYLASRLDLSALSGQSLRLRFRIGTDSSGWDYGWFIDDIRLYSCVASTPVIPTTVAPSPTIRPPTQTATPQSTATSHPTATAHPTATPHRVRLPAVLAR